MVDPRRHNPGRGHAPNPTLDARAPAPATPGATLDGPIRIPMPETATRPARIGLAHDWLVGLRGGERVLDRLAALVARDHEPARLYTLFDDGTPHTEAIDALQRVVSRLQDVPGGAGALRRWLFPLYPGAIESLSRRLEADHGREPIDLLVSTSSAAIKGLRPPRGVPHLCYCHSPARYAWSQRAAYAAGSLARGLALRAYAPHFKRWDRRTAGRVTRFVANSTHTAEEIRRCYGREAGVVFPPVRTNWFTPEPSIEREGFWLCAGALEPYKRTDLAIDAAARAGAELIIVGEGSMRQRLERRAVQGVRFLGRVDDETLRDLYRRARLLIHPQIEDFGIIAAEAQACGCPVLARDAGGARDSVIDGETGARFASLEPSAIAETAQRVPADADDACRRHAERFSEARFDAAMAREIESMLDGAGSPEAPRRARAGG